MNERLHGFNEPTKDVLTSGETISIAPPITANELMGKQVPEKKPLSLSTSPIYLYGHTRRVGNSVSSEFAAVIDSPLRGRALNELLLSIAPYKDYGLDTEDILTDWVDIERTSNGMEARRERHSHMGLAWSMFQKEKPLILDVIGTDFLGNKRWRRANSIPSGDGMVPVVFWRKYNEDKRFLPLVTMQEDTSSVLTDYIQENHTAVIDGQNVANGFSRTIGIWALAHYSPDIKQTWPQALGYSATTRQVMGPTQASVLALLHSPSLLDSTFLTSAELYLEKYVKSLPYKKW